MKSFALLFILLTVAACDPYKFGFKKNPAYVLDEAFKSITNQDTETFLEMTGKEALCIYGNQEGIAYLKERVTLTPQDVKIDPKVYETKHFINPKFVGFWSYYHARYQINILDKVTAELLMMAVVDCEYGTEGEKSETLVNLKPNKYKKKECRLIKIEPKTFPALPMPAKCEELRVTL